MATSVVVKRIVSVLASTLIQRRGLCSLTRHVDAPRRRPYHGPPPKRRLVRRHRPHLLRRSLLLLLAWNPLLRRGPERLSGAGASDLLARALSKGSSSEWISSPLGARHLGFATPWRSVSKAARSTTSPGACRSWVRGCTGASRWQTDKSRRGTWRSVDGAKWELYFQWGRGLTILTARYASESELRQAIASWGAPAVARSSFMPRQSVEASLERIFPKGETLVGLDSTKLDFGEGLYQGDYTLYFDWPLPTSDWIGIQIRFDQGRSGRVVSYRTELEYTYAAASDRSARALSQRLPNLAAIRDVRAPSSLALKFRSAGSTRST